VADGADVDVRLGSLKFAFCHFSTPEICKKLQSQLTTAADRNTRLRPLKNMVPIPGIGPGTSPLPRECSATEPNGPKKNLHSSQKPWPRKLSLPARAAMKIMERETGIGPASLAWKARVLPLNYSRAVLPSALTNSKVTQSHSLAKSLKPPVGKFEDNAQISVTINKNLVDEAGFEPA
jgi:hypothetical protein